jgi:hypothetical protein
VGRPPLDTGPVGTDARLQRRSKRARPCGGGVMNNAMQHCQAPFRGTPVRGRATTVATLGVVSAWTGATQSVHLAQPTTQAPLHKPHYTSKVGVDRNVHIVVDSGSR